ncbi:LAME_0C02102g1_1 [Lachancea meyersii CBS 8951]|uniref:LAME_0C02102g1_1 n=1 Tax=Lachancea meyersii CBS 8951 TaxID=1266667 RepID=A0A1G4IZA6_9SACH|nr:LAME_0C02102g1_1 [Lachancea meyersii CBS 8951]
MSGRLVLKELKVGLNLNSNKYPVTPKTRPVSLSSTTELDSNSLASVRDLGVENNFFGKANKKLAKYRKKQDALLNARSKLRGTVSIAQVYQNTFRVFSAQSKVYHCDFFRLLYFPPDHILSVFRKSKPAVNVRIVGEVFLNGNVSRGENGRSVANTAVFERGSRIDKYGKSLDVSNLKRLQSIFAHDGSNVPRNYAYLRRSLRTFLHGCFIENWTNLKGAQAVEEQITREAQSSEANASADWKFLDSDGRSNCGVAKDGFYLFQVLVFPDNFTKHEFETNVAQSVQAVADLQWDKFLRGKPNIKKTWVEQANDRVRVPVMNTYLAHGQVPRTLKRLT